MCAPDHQVKEDKTGKACTT